MGYTLLGKSWNREEFRSYAQGLNLGWASSVTVHHTGCPNLSQRPKGLTLQHVRNIASFYKRKGWSRGPHLFTDDTSGRCILGMSSLEERGIHAKSFNRTSIGIEMLGDYDYTDDPFTGRGLRVLKNTAFAVRVLLDKMGLPINETTVKFHRDDPKTSKECAGKKISKARFLAFVEDAYQGGSIQPGPIVRGQAPTIRAAVKDNLRKPAFFGQDFAALLEEANQGASKPLTLVEFVAVGWAEAGLSNGKVSNAFMHSEGEPGIFPLPSWLPGWDKPKNPTENVLAFMQVLVAYKNTYEHYPALFNVPWTEEESAMVLQGAVHGWFSTYTNKGTLDWMLVMAALSTTGNKAAIQKAHEILGYKWQHKPQIVSNRLDNIAAGIKSLT